MLVTKFRIHLKIRAEILLDSKEEFFIKVVSQSIEIQISDTPKMENQIQLNFLCNSLCTTLNNSTFKSSKKKPISDNFFYQKELN